MVVNPQKIFTIHFPDKKVYIENTSKSFHDKMEYIKNDKDHLLYSLLKEYPNPEIRFECFQDKSCFKKQEIDEEYIKDFYKSCFKNKQEIAKKYRKDFYKILNLNLLPSPRYNLFQSLYKWMSY